MKMNIARREEVPGKRTVMRTYPRYDMIHG